MGVNCKALTLCFNFGGGGLWGWGGTGGQFAVFTFFVSSQKYKNRIVRERCIHERMKVIGGGGVGGCHVDDLGLGAD